MPDQTPSRRPVSEAHARLGRELRRVRKAAGLNTRSVTGFSAGHVSNVENGHVAPSTGFVETYIRLFGGSTEILALYGQVRVATDRTKSEKLKQRWQQVGELAPPQNLGEVSSQEDVTKHYDTVTHEANCLFSPDGAIKELRSRVWLRARTPEVKLFYAGGFYDADKRRGVLQAEALTGLSLLTQQENDAGLIKAYFELDRGLDPDEAEPYEASYVMCVTSEKRALPQLVFYSRPGTVRMSLRATFHASARPRQLWSFSAPNIVNIQHRPEDELSPDERFSYHSDFSPTIPSWCYGFSWLW